MGEGGEGRVVALGKGPPIAMRRLGGPSEGQLGPDPHLGALDRKDSMRPKFTCFLLMQTISRFRAQSLTLIDSVRL